ncbi:hypothetical protein MHBO_001893 [Bonamia ostreae]|uniref:Uncharacterized protein n=1 Tax=Bonamia ostreae TaxID=126728 RepID=A0ABV2ALL6_9EUKA
MDDVEKLNETMRFFDFAYTKQSSFSGTLCFEIRTKDDQILTRTVRINGPKRTINIYEDRPKDIEIDCDLELSLETFLELYSGKHPLPYLINGSVRIENVWSKRSVISGFSRCFNFESENWDKFYQQEKAPEIKLKQESLNAKNDMRRNPTDSQIPKDINESTTSYSVLSNSCFKEFWSVEEQRQIFINPCFRKKEFNIFSKPAMLQIWRSPRPSKILKAISSFFGNKKF